MNRKIIYLPLDERPCNYNYPQAIADIGGAELIVPPIELMGNFKQPASIDALWDWFLEQAGNAEYAVVSMDLLCYGGIVPSRLHSSTLQTCLERANRLRSIAARFPALRIFAFQLITRAPARNGSGEEPDYYEEHGYNIWKYGVLCDKEQSGVTTADDYSEKERILSFVPQSILQDFLLRREINFNMNRHTLELAKDGVIDHLVIPLDDCAQYGYAPSERRRLAQHAAQLGILSKIALYPGADEMGCTLVARALCAIEKYKPLVNVEYSSNSGMLTIPQYEDRSIVETVPQHIRCAGAAFAEKGCFLHENSSADIALMVNPPTAFSNRIKFELDRRNIYLEPERNLPLFIDKIGSYCEKSRADNFVCALADCAIPDGADECLMQFLREQAIFDKVDVFGAWNTSSNTLGTVIAHSIALFFAKGKSQNTTALQESYKFRFARYIEDWVYMTHVRQNISSRVTAGEYGNNISTRYLKDKTTQIAADITHDLREFATVAFAGTRIAADAVSGGIEAIHAELPWKRLFEIDLKLTEK